jgi:hypothetical protein
LEKAKSLNIEIWDDNELNKHLQQDVSFGMEIVLFQGECFDQNLQNLF